MTTKADFNGEEWGKIAEAPALAGLIVIASQRGGTVRETIAMAKVYAETQKSHPSGDLVGDLVAAAPSLDAKQFSSREDMRTRGLTKITEAVDLVKAKATPGELEDYRKFAMTIAEHVAERDKSGGFLGIGGERIDADEAKFRADLASALGA